MKKGIADNLVERKIDAFKFLNIDEINFLKNINLSKNEFKIAIFQQNLQNLMTEYLNTPSILGSKFSSKYEALLNFFHENNLLIGLNKVKIKNLPRVIKIGYKLLEKLISLNNIENLNNCRDVIIPRKKKQRNLDKKNISEFINFSKVKLSPFMHSSFIHGSCADNSITDYSDLDTFLIINKETVFNVEQLKRLKIQWLKSLKYLYMFDPLQHHNHLFCTEIDLKHYPSNWLPPVAFEDGVCISEKNVVSITLICNVYYRVINFYNLTERFRNGLIKNKIYNEFTFKNDLSVIYLFPVLFLQALGHKVSKKDSFNHKLLSELKISEFFTKVSEIRSNWRTSLISKIVISIKYNFFVRKYYLRFLMKPLNNNSFLEDGKLKKNFINEFNEVLNKMSEQIINKNINE